MPIPAPGHNKPDNTIVLPCLHGNGTPRTILPVEFAGQSFQNGVVHYGE